MVADNPDQMTKNKGYLRTKSAAELPTQDGLTWQYQSSSRLRAVTGTWINDRAIVCDVVLGIFTPPEVGLNYSKSS